MDFGSVLGDVLKFLFFVGLFILILVLCGVFQLGRHFG